MSLIILNDNHSSGTLLDAYFEELDRDIYQRDMGQRNTRKLTAIRGQN